MQFLNQNLKIEYIPIEDIKPYENNGKLHPAEQIQQIKNSILEFGFKDPIAVWHNIIVEGHGRLLAAQELGYKELPIIRLDDLSDEQRKAYCLAHNKLTMNSDFDFDILTAEIDEIEKIDMSDFGFELDGGFDMENIEEVNGFDENNNDKEYFTAAFTFPTAQKEQILKYLRKHKAEITADIIQKARNE